MIFKSSQLRYSFTLLLLLSLAGSSVLLAQQINNKPIRFEGTNYLVVDAAKGATSVNITYAHPAAYTSCPEGKAVVSLTKGPVSGTAFPIGKTVLYFTASDACGNEAVFQMLIEVRSPAKKAELLGTEIKPAEPDNGVQEH